jgi:CelD/BcsL family acetyltransferase involved in cellulose biosynthesis
MSIRVVTSEEEFAGLQSAWRELYDSNRNHSPFQSWEWNHTWWKHHGAPGRLRLLLVQEEGGLIGIAPFQLVARFRGWPLTHLAFIAHKRSDYLDFLVRPGKEAVFFQQLFAGLQESGAGWCLIDLRDVPGASTNLPHIVREASRVFPSLSLEAGENCVTVPLTPTWEEFLATLGKKARRNAGYYRRYLESHFRVSFVIPKSADEFRKCFDDFVDIYRSRWRDVQGATYFEQPKATAFEREICRLGANDGWYRLYILYAGDVPVAGYVGYVRNNKYYAGLTGHRPDFHKYSVGTVLIGMTIADCIANGWSELDFMRGEDAYKFQWNGVKKPNYQVRVFRGRRAMAIAAALEWIYQALVSLKALHYLRARLLSWRLAARTRDSSPV